jgi:hypothetical protein
MMADVMASFAQFERPSRWPRRLAASSAAELRSEISRRPIAAPEPVRGRIAREKGAGSTLAATADRLNAQRVPTVSGRPWGTSSVQKVCCRWNATWPRLARRPCSESRTVSMSA